MSGPALGVISQAIKLWLKSVCSQLEHLDLKLQGSLWRLLQGHLAGSHRSRPRRGVSRPRH